MLSHLKSGLRRLPPIRASVDAARRGWNGAGLRLAERIASSGPYEILVVFGMRRSGNHVAISWILEQVEGAAAFYNNINPDLAPYTARMTEFRLRNRSPGPRIVLSYEDVGTDRLLSPPLLDYLGDRTARHGARVRFALVLRDPRNLFASRLKKWPDRFQGEAKLAEERALYLEHAGLALEPRPIWRDAPLVPILYNRFVTDAAARRAVGDALGLGPGDRGLDAVPVYGHGSSFQGYGVTGDAVREGAFARWREMEDDPTFCALALDAQVAAAGARLFGADLSAPVSADGRAATRPS